MRWILIVLVLLLALAAVSGCPRGQGSVAEKVKEQPGEPVVGKRGETGAKTPETKSDATPGKPAEVPAAAMPAEWPADLPQYPGSTITAATSRSENGGVFVALMLKTNDSPDKVLKYYDEKALAAGLRQLKQLPLPAGGGSVTYESDAATFSVETSQITGETSTHVSLIYKLKPLGDGDKPLANP
jgi:hypothetical protein